MKRLVTLLLAAMMLLTCMPAALADGEVKELDVMVWYRDIDDLYFSEMPYYNDPEIGITAQTGVKANFNAVKESSWSTKLNLMVASGEYPDIVMRGNVNLEMYGVDQEVFIPLDDYIDQYMPNFKSRLDADPSLIDSLRSSDGHVYQIGWLIPQNINTDSHLFINKQWLDNLGVAMPTSLEEYEQALIAIRDGDADLDGDPANEIPLSGTYDGMVDGLIHMFSFWGVPFNTQYVTIAEDGKTVVSPLLNDGLRLALETLNRWYSEGLIDIEAVTQDMNSFEAKINANQLGSFWRWRMTAKGTDEAVYKQYECLIPFDAEGYEAKLPRYLEIPTFGAAITVGCEDVEAACKWLDCHLDFENMISGYNGAKGEYWDYDAQGKVEIFPVDTPTRSVPGQSGLIFMGGEQYFSLVNMPSHRIEKTTYCTNYDAAGTIETHSWHTLTKLMTMNVEESTQMELLFAEIDKYATEAITEFIVKGVTDEGWQTYLDTLNNVRINDYIAVYQQAYDRYLTTK